MDTTRSRGVYARGSLWHEAVYEDEPKKVWVKRSLHCFSGCKSILTAGTSGATNSPSSLALGKQ